jgi:amino acid transporter
MAGTTDCGRKIHCDALRRLLVSIMALANLLIGKPLSTEADDEERVGPLTGVPVLGLDALASAAYGPEALLTVLLPLGTAALDYIAPSMALIAALLVIVFLSYRQTIGAYPSGGGAYSVAKENLGRNASLLAAAALGLDYLLNVAVAIAAGVGAVVSAVPALLPYTLPLCLALLLFLVLVNLRGVRSAGLVFMLPTWLFVACMLALIALGVSKVWASGGHPIPVVPPRHVPATLSAPSLWLLLHAFSSGCSAMTGVEAVSNAVPIFKPPTLVNARRALGLIIAVLLVLLGGETYLCRAYQITATPPGAAGFQSLISQLLAAVGGQGTFYYLTIASVVTVLCLSANTSFAGFPRLCRILAEDKFLPEPFVHRGRRLAYSHGIVVLGLLSALLLIGFGGITDRLIPLFAIGALLAFTMSQAGMVKHWLRHKSSGSWRALTLNAIGTVATGAAALVVLVSKFSQGAWISLLLIGAMLALFRQVRRHFVFLSRATATSASLEIGPPRPPLAVVPLRRWDAVALKALRFAVGFAPDVIAVQVLTGDREVDDLSARWEQLAREPARRLAIKPPDLVVLRSDYRHLFTPLLDFVSELAREHPDRQVAVIVPELVERRWYHFLLHNHSASLLKTMLLIRGGPQVVIVSTPWYLKDWLPERRDLQAG